MDNWEEKFNNFKEGKPGDSEMIAICQKLIEYVKANPEEIKSQITSNSGERADSMPWVSTETWEFDGTIDGHSVYWNYEEAMDQDGDETDPDYTLEVDGITLYDSWINHSQISKELEKVGWDLYDEIGALSGSPAF